MLLGSGRPSLAWTRRLTAKAMECAMALLMIRAGFADGPCPVAAAVSATVSVFAAVVGAAGCPYMLVSRCG